MIITSITLFLLILFSPVSYAINIPAGEVAPDFNLTTLEDESLSLSDNDGKVTVLIYWRTDHKRSLLALKDAKEIVEKFKKKDIRIITFIAETDDMALVKSTLADNEMDFPVIVDYGRQFYSDYGIRVYPTTIIVAKKGVITHSIPSHPLTYRKLFKAYILKSLGKIDENKLNEMLSPQNEKIDKVYLESMRLYNLAIKYKHQK